MVDIKQLKKEREEDILQSLEIIDIMVEWIKKKPNKIWSKKQADYFKAMYKSINANR